MLAFSIYIMDRITAHPYPYKFVTVHCLIFAVVNQLVSLSNNKTAINVGKNVNGSFNLSGPVKLCRHMDYD